MANKHQQEVAESFFPTHLGPLDKYVAARRADGLSWAKVRDDVNDQLPGALSVSHESLRNWYSERASA